MNCNLLYIHVHGYSCHSFVDPEIYMTALSEVQLPNLVAVVKNDVSALMALKNILCIFLPWTLTD